MSYAGDMVDVASLVDFSWGSPHFPVAFSPAVAGSMFEVLAGEIEWGSEQKSFIGGAANMGAMLEIEAPELEWGSHHKPNHGNVVYSGTMKTVWATALPVTPGDTMVEIIVGVAPDLAFEAIPVRGYSPLFVQFINLSFLTGYDVSWLWDFGDGQTSTDIHPTHIYERRGVYTVTLRAQITEDLYSRLEKEDYIRVYSQTLDLLGQLLPYDSDFPTGLVSVSNPDSDIASLAFGVDGHHGLLRTLLP